jgi:hypothetical protein
MNDTDPGDLTPTHHALLFAWLARAVIRRAGKSQGEAIVRQAVRRYGEQRGRRMAMRALSDGQALTMNAYMAYGEWRAAAGQADSAMVQEFPLPIGQVYRCPWHEAWEDQDVMAYGRLYCLEVDHALVRGFNPDLRLDINSIKSAGDDFCEFAYYGADLSEPAQSGRPTVMPWDYHLGHLYKTVGQVVLEEIGEPGAEAVSEALAEFAACFGQDAAAAIEAYGDTDFDSLPEG